MMNARKRAKNGARKRYGTRTVVSRRLRRNGGDAAARFAVEEVGRPASAKLIASSRSPTAGMCEARRGLRTSLLRSAFYRETLILGILDERVLQAVERLRERPLAARGRRQFVAHG